MVSCAGLRIKRSGFKGVYCGLVLSQHSSLSRCITGTGELLGQPDRMWSVL